ncbi:MAG: hypothetical protein PWP65_1807 [Clostridia bacterium]|nr:hypothetical protein [Clostridia bacterium]
MSSRKRSWPAGAFRRMGLNLRALGQGIREGLTPMLGKEMRSRTRGWRSPVLLSAYLLILSAGVSLSLWLMLEQANIINPQIGLSLYGFFVLTLVMLVAFIAPAIAAGSISGERERRTYDLLMVTKASPLGIVLGKWLASVAYLIFLMMAALPVFAIVFLFGGVPPATLGMALLVATATGMGYGALGLLFSALLRRTQLATITSLILIFIFIFGTLAAGVVASSVAGPPPYGRYGPEFGPPPAAPWYVYLSPLTALGSVLPGGNINYMMGQGVPLLGSILRELLQHLFQGGIEYAYKMGYAYPGINVPQPTGLAAWEPWARFTLYQGILIIACLLLAVLSITPVKPWTAYLLRRRLRRQAVREASNFEAGG